LPRTFSSQNVPIPPPLHEFRIPPPPPQTPCGSPQRLVLSLNTSSRPQGKEILAVLLSFSPFPLLPSVFFFFSPSLSLSPQTFLLTGFSPLGVFYFLLPIHNLVLATRFSSLPQLFFFLPLFMCFAAIFLCYLSSPMITALQPLKPPPPPPFSSLLLPDSS